MRVLPSSCVGFVLLMSVTGCGSDPPPAAVDPDTGGGADSGVTPTSDTGTDAGTGAGDAGSDAVSDTPTEAGSGPGDSGSDSGRAAGDGGVVVGPATTVCPAKSSGKQITVAPSGGDYKTIQAGLDAAVAGDTVLVRAGTYNEGVSFKKSGSASAGCITLQGEPGAIVDGAGKPDAGITITSQSYLRVISMTVQNFKGAGTPMGISVSGSASYIEVRDNLVHHIESAADAHGIAFYGTASTPMSNLFIDGNEIRDCKLGSSESMVLNGNVTTFVVSHNTVHDNDNIGIDFIGFEGTGPAGQDQARNGVCVDNTVYNISSATNPAYAGERSADGLYVDGGRDIVLERNKVDSSDIGIEVASEHQGKSTSNIVVRNNFVARSYQGNIMMGGYASNRGNADAITVVGNTLFQATSGEIILQNNCKGVIIEDNILFGKAGLPYVDNAGTNNTAVTVDTNLFFGASTTSAGAFPDAHGKFVNPLLVGAPTDLHLQASSPAIDAGLTLGALSGVLDIDGTTRVRGPAIDLGADER